MTWEFVFNNCPQGNLYLPSVTVCVVKFKNIIKMFFNMDDCFYIFGRLMEKNKKKRKTEAVCDVCCKFRARRNKVTHCLTSGVQPKLFKCLCSNSFWLRPFRGSLWQATSSSYLFKQEANLSLAVLPFFDIAIVGRGNAKRARLSHPVREKRNTNHYPQSLACATVKFSVEAPMSFVLWAGI